MFRTTTNSGLSLEISMIENLHNLKKLKVLQLGNNCIRYIGDAFSESSQLQVLVNRGSCYS